MSVRVYELSKKLGLTNKTVIDAAGKIGISLKSHASSVSEDQADKITKSLGKTNVPLEDSVITNSSPKEEVKEEVKVFKTDSGEEIVERRKGNRVVLRKKKKQIVQEEEIKEQLQPVDQPPDIKEKIENQETQEVSINTSNIETDKVKIDEVINIDHINEINDTIEPEDDVEVANQLDSISEDEIPDLIDDTSKDKVIEDKGIDKKGNLDKFGEQAKDETRPKVQKKKLKKVKPTKEEIIDEDTLEELRKAFRTKLHGRRREYLVEDRKQKRGFPDRVQKIRSSSAAKLKNKGSILSIETDDAKVIQFPAKPSARNIKIPESIIIGDLAKRMSVKAGDVIKKLLALGMKTTINQSVDYETAIIVAEEFDYKITVDKYEEEDYLIDKVSDESDTNIGPRPPVVTVMGHVDHGKTTLLDSIRETNVVGGEAGGITQHIGAYSVSVNNKQIAFIDTPGHEAFTSMRARGAKVTDIVILVVAADDGVMPQTVEAVNHAKVANVPIIVAINKIDKQGADTDKIRRELSDIGLLDEKWGGDTLFAEVSAKTKEGLNDLLELIILQSEVLELTADINKRANGVVVESKLSKGWGPVATIIVTEGTLKVGSFIVAGTTSGKIRALTDGASNKILSVGPSIPVEVMGLSGVPDAGEKFYVVKDDRTAKDVVSHRESKKRINLVSEERKHSLDNLFDSIEKKDVKELPLILKADTQGSVEALKDSVLKLDTDKCNVKVVHDGVGAITESDILLASASNAIVVGFNVRPNANALAISEKEGVSLELHTIIYDLISRVKSAMEGLLEPILMDKVVGHVDIKETFHISKLGTIAGCMVSDGRVSRNDNVRVLRDGVIINEGKLKSLKRFKDDAREVQSGYECGIGIENFNDIKVGDVLELYVIEEQKQEL